MEHLTIEDIIQFVTISVIDESSIRLASKVNTHILQCDLCRKKVSAFQTVYDEFLSNNASKNQNTVDVHKLCDSMDDDIITEDFR